MIFSDGKDFFDAFPLFPWLAWMKTKLSRRHHWASSATPLWSGFKEAGLGLFSKSTQTEL